MSAIDNLSEEDKKFLAESEDEFKDRYSENDEEFMKVFSSDSPKPPIIESWWPSQNSDRRNDRRYNRRDQPYDQRNRSGHYQDRRDDRRGCSNYSRDNNDRRYGGYDRKPRY